MSRPEDTEPIAPEAELRLVELLYGELSGEDAARARAAIEEDEELAGQLAALSGLRELWGELADEEPPPSISAKLLHEAAAAAPKSAPSEERRSFFDRVAAFFRPVMLHPGLAAAASLILVAGVAGAVYLSGSWRTAEPKVGSPASADRPEGPARIEENADTKTVAPSPDPAPDDDVEPGSKLDGKRYIEDLSPDEPAPLKKEAKPAKTGKAQRALRRRKIVRDEEKKPQVAQPPRPTSARPPAPPPAPPAKPGIGGGSGAVVPMAEPIVPATKSAPRKQKVRVERSRAPAGTQYKESDKDTETPVSLHRRAQKAAQGGDCARARSLAGQVQKLDARYYRAKVSGDPALAPCLRGVPARQKK